MGFALGFLPWVLYWALIGNVPFRVAAVLVLVVAIAVQVIGRLRRQPVAAWRWASLAVFALLTVAAFVVDDDVLARWMQPLSNLGIFLVALGGLAVGRPFVREYAAASVDAPHRPHRRLRDDHPRHDRAVGRGLRGDDGRVRDPAGRRRRRDPARTTATCSRSSATGCCPTSSSPSAAWCRGSSRRGSRSGRRWSTSGRRPKRHTRPRSGPARPMSRRRRSALEVPAVSRHDEPFPVVDPQGVARWRCGARRGRWRRPVRPAPGAPPPRSPRPRRGRSTSRWPHRMTATGRTPPTTPRSPRCASSSPTSRRSSSCRRRRRGG